MIEIGKIYRVNEFYYYENNWENSEVSHDFGTYEGARNYIYEQCEMYLMCDNYIAEFDSKTMTGTLRSSESMELMYEIEERPLYK